MNDKEYLEYFKNHIKEFYGLPTGTKIVLFQNPINFKIEHIENINPTHIKIIYGRRWNNKSNVEKIAKILIPSIVFSNLLVISIYISIINLCLVSSLLIIGAYTFNLCKIFCDRFFNFYKLFGCGIYKSRKYNYRYIWI